MSSFFNKSFSCFLWLVLVMVMVSKTTFASATNTPTPTPSPTAVTTTFLDDFYYSDDNPASSPGDLPPGWNNRGPVYRDWIIFQYHNTDGLVDIIEGDLFHIDAKTYTTSKPVSLITATSHYLEIGVNSIDASSSLKIGVMKSNGSYVWPSQITGPGQYSFDLLDTSWDNVNTFQIMLIINGDRNNRGRAVIDSVAITNFVQPTMTPTLTPTPYPEAWEDDFQGGTPGDFAVKWQNHGITLRAAIERSSVASYAIVKKVENPYNPANWGKVISQPITTNVDYFSKLSVTISQVAPNTGWKVGVERGSSFIPLCSSQNQPGEYTFDYAQTTGWSGNQTFVVVLLVEGYASNNSHYAVDYVTIKHGSISPTPTITPTAEQTNAWQEQFLGVSGDTAQGWYDNSSNPDYYASIQYSYTSSWGIVTRDASSTWGKALSPSVTLDTSLYNLLEINVARVSPSATWKVGIQETEGSWQYFDLSSSSNQTGTFVFDYAAITGFTGTKTFAVQVIVEGDLNEYIEMGHIRIYKPGIPFTQTTTPTSTITLTSTITKTSTHTPTVTPTMTITPTSTPLPSDTFFDNFIGTAGSQPEYWWEYDTEMVYSPTYSVASITRTATNTWGKVLAPYVSCNVDIYDTVEVNITDISPNATYKIGIQEYDSPWRYWDLGTSSDQTGVRQFDIPSITGLSGTNAFLVQVTLEGAAGTWMSMDWLRVCQAGTAQGSSVASSFIGLFVPSTSTPTSTPTSTVTPPATPATSENTKTPTPSTTPYVVADKVLAFPNPARERVAFAYTVQGQAYTTIDLYTLAGERIAHISDQKNADGVCTTTWEAADVAPGIYLARIIVKDANGTVVLNKIKKIALIK